MRRLHLGNGFGTELASNDYLQSVSQTVWHSSIRSKKNYKGLSKIIAQISTSLKFVTTIFVFIIAISFWIYNHGFVYEKDKIIIFQLHPRYENASFEDILIQEVGHTYHPRNLLNTKKPLIWMVESFYYFFYIELNIAGKFYHMTVDSGSTLSWVNCKLIDHHLGPSPNYLGKLNEPYIPHGDKLVLEGNDLCEIIQDWRDKDKKIVVRGTDGKSKYCTYAIYYGDGTCFAKGVWVKDTIEYQTFFEKKTHQAYFGCTYEFVSNYLDPRLDGILGLQHLQDVSLASQLTTGIKLPDVFGHCIFMKESEQASGYLIFGWDHNLPMSAGIKWVPMNKPEEYRQRLLKMYQLSYGEDKLEVQIGNVVFDSGSIETYMAESIYNLLYSKVTNHASNLGYEQDDILDHEGFKKICWKVNANFNPNAFNKIIFQFENEVDMEILPSKFIRCEPNEKHYCLGLLLDEESLHTTASLGGIWLTDKLVVYDNEELRIGFKDSDCKLPGDNKRKKGPADPGPNEEAANKKRIQF